MLRIKQLDALLVSRCAELLGTEKPTINQMIGCVYAHTDVHLKADDVRLLKKGWMNIKAKERLEACADFLGLEREDIAEIRPVPKPQSLSVRPRTTIAELPPVDKALALQFLKHEIGRKHHV